MNTNHEKNAEFLEESLKTGRECNIRDLKPLSKVAEALNREASSNADRLDPVVASATRDKLITMTEKTSETLKRAEAVSEASKAAPIPTEKVGPHRMIPWYAWVVGTAAAVASLALLVIVYSGPMNQPIKQMAGLMEVVPRFVIPEAHAGDAFSVIAENQDAAGMDIQSGFVVTSSIPVTGDDIAKHLVVMPPVSASDPSPAALAVNVKSLSENKFLVTPAEPLLSGKVYKFKLATAIEKNDGTVINRDFSWAFQTKNIFRVTSSVPGSDTASVPVNSSIEFTMSMMGWEDATSSFTIEPKVDGRFEAHGRSLAFVPNKPLAYGRIYIATLKKGFKIANSDSVLLKDVVVRFETEPLNQAMNGARKVEIHPSTSIVVASPGKEIAVPTWYYEIGGISDIPVIAYRLSAEQATDLLIEESKIPEFAGVTRNRGDVFAKYAKNKTAEISAVIEEREYQRYLVMQQGLPQGHYVMQIAPKDGVATWFYLESTKVATYAIADNVNTVLWAVNTETNRPLSELPVAFKDTKTKTDANGVVKFVTPTEVVATSTRSAVIVKLGQGDLETLIRLERGYSFWDYGYNDSAGLSDENVSYLYVDRPIYHPTDRALAYGVVQGRTSQSAVSGLTFELTRNGIYDFFEAEKNKSYSSVDVIPDENGFFKASLDWSSLASGYYNLDLKKDGRVLSSQYVEIRDFQKPSYTLEVITSKKAVYAGESIEGQVKASFYDGTPMTNLKVALRTYGNVSNHTEMTLVTDDDGMVSFKLPTQQQKCDPYVSNYYCPSYGGLSIEVRPTEGEEAQILAIASVNVWNSRASLEAKTQIQDNKATIAFTARQVDLSRTQNENEWNVLGDALRGKRITGKIIETHW